MEDQDFLQSLVTGLPTSDPSRPSVSEPVEKTSNSTIANAHHNLTLRTRDSNMKPLVIGLYGISGSGKSYLLDQLRQTDIAKHLDFVDGSCLIDIRFGLAKFKESSPEEQGNMRLELMLELVKERRKLGKGIVIAGHLLLPDEKNTELCNIGTEADWNAYTHMVYLQVDSTVVHARRAEDQAKLRSAVPANFLKRWQLQERADLREICYKRRIAFTTVTESSSKPQGETLKEFENLLKHFLTSSEKENLKMVESTLDTIMSQHNAIPETMLVFDADKTLAPQDASNLFCELGRNDGVPEDALAMILKQQGYSYESFQQVALFYEELSKNEFNMYCNLAASCIGLYPEISALLARVATDPNTGAVIVTCGLRKVWETVLRISGLTHVKVIGGGNLDNKLVITDSIKGHIVTNLRDRNIRVVAFGDSPVDVQMLRNANEAYIVVGEEQVRSASMDRKLIEMITDGYSPKQLLFPDTVRPRLTEAKLPIVKLGKVTLDNIFKRRFIHANDRASAKLLATTMRDAAISGHDLRKAHAETGYYLATEFLGEVLGLETYEIDHVQGKKTNGHRFRNEHKTLIVPLMRGGEAMAFGVSKALKLASFVHSKQFADIDPQHLNVKETIILVDSVINSGKSIMEYLLPLRKQCPEAKVVVVAGVVQAEAISGLGDGTLGQALGRDPDLTIVALRKSDNKYSGSGTDRYRAPPL